MRTSTIYDVSAKFSVVSPTVETTWGYGMKETIYWILDKDHGYSHLTLSLLCLHESSLHVICDITKKASFPNFSLQYRVPAINYKCSKFSLMFAFGNDCGLTDTFFSPSFYISPNGKPDKNRILICDLAENSTTASPEITKTQKPETKTTDEHKTTEQTTIPPPHQSPDQSPDQSPEPIPDLTKSFQGPTTSQPLPTKSEESISTESENPSDTKASETASPSDSGKEKKPGDIDNNYSYSISSEQDDSEEQSESSSDSAIQTFSQQLIHKSNKTGHSWAIGSLAKEISEYSHLLKVLNTEKKNNLSLHFYSNFKQRNKIHEHQYRPLIKKQSWISSSITQNDQLSLDDFIKTYIKPLEDELEACIFRIATKKIHSRHLEPTSEDKLPINIFQYIFKIVLSRIDKLLLTLLHSRHIQGSDSSRSRLRHLRWDDVLGHASIASAFPSKDIINTSNICSFLFSENISWNTLETPMQFEDVEYLRKKGWDILSEIPNYKKPKRKNKDKKNQ
ncbi:hypothetical protein PCANB_000828 [Pneumocystis canis]|nr:hypothetical protein PCANB_000828 [Pneumocystis canis]